MKHNFIRYEQLVKEIKGEIDKFHVEEENSSESIEISVKKWFASHFDSWLKTRFVSDDEDNNDRKFYRMEIELPVNIVEKLIDSTGEDENAKSIIGHAINISRGGLYFLYQEPIEISSIIRVKIDLTASADDSRQVEALAMVVRCDALDEKFGIGIMFSSIYEEDRESLDLFFLQQLALYLYH